MATAVFSILGTRTVVPTYFIYMLLIQLTSMENRDVYGSGVNS